MEKKAAIADVISGGILAAILAVLGYRFMFGGRQTSSDPYAAQQQDLSELQGLMGTPGNERSADTDRRVAELASMVSGRSTQLKDPQSSAMASKLAMSYFAGSDLSKADPDVLKNILSQRFNSKGIPLGSEEWKNQNNVADMSAQWLPEQTPEQKSEKFGYQSVLSKTKIRDFINMDRPDLAYAEANGMLARAAANAPAITAPQAVKDVDDAYRTFKQLSEKYPEAVGATEYQMNEAHANYGKFLEGSPAANRTSPLSGAWGARALGTGAIPSAPILGAISPSSFKGVDMAINSINTLNANRAAGGTADDAAWQNALKSSEAARNAPQIAAQEQAGFEDRHKWLAGMAKELPEALYGMKELGSKTYAGLSDAVEAGKRGAIQTAGTVVGPVLRGSKGFMQALAGSQAKRGSEYEAEIAEQGRRMAGAEQKTEAAKSALAQTAARNMNAINAAVEALDKPDMTLWKAKQEADKSYGQ
jgi:hypothetical protein